MDATFFDFTGDAVPNQGGDFEGTYNAEFIIWIVLEMFEEVTS